MIATDTRAAASTRDDDFALIARAFVAEDEFERDADWQRLAECLTTGPADGGAPEMLAAPPIGTLSLGTVLATA